jgi:hypothetical protein
LSISSSETLRANAVAMGRFFLKILGFLGLVTALQLFFPPLSEPLRITELNTCLENGSEVIVFGNSTFFGAKSDTIQKHMCELLAETLPAASLGNMMRASLHIGIIRDFSIYMAAHPRKPRIVIVPINLHSFSPRWDRRPEYQFPTLAAALRVWNTPLHWPSRVFHRALCISGFWDLTPITQEDFEHETVFDGDSPVGRVAGFMAEFEYSPEIKLEARSDTAIRRQLLFYFMNRITPEHRKSRAMVETARIFRDAGIRPIFLIMPVDVEFGRRYLGERFPARIAENSALLLSLLEAENVTAIDMSAALPSDLFYREFVSDEHMVYEGRRRVAAELIERILRPNEPGNGGIAGSNAYFGRRASPRAGSL